MEGINWWFQIPNWIITIIVIPFLAHFITKSQMENKHKNDLQIQKLIKSQDMLSKEATSINYITHANLSYFNNILR